MTVSYSRLVANGSSFGCFWSILFKWRGSVYKLVWRELVAYLAIYFSINFTYRYALNEQQQRTFETIRLYFYKHSENIPMAFVLGFYVTLVVKRWWEQYRLLPWPDTLALFVSAAIPGVDERGRLMRRTIVRYAVLAYVITLKHVSVRVKKRFPTLQHIVDAGLMMESEKKILEMLDDRHPMAKYWLPLTWATNIINRARKESLILSDHMVQTLLTEMSDMRWRLGSLIGYDNVTVPLVYTQVVTLSVYIYFMAALIGRQFVNPPHGANLIENIDIYFPVVTALQFCFYIGWLKVAEVLIGPFGEDDDDIELNWLIDRHIKAAYMIVDEMHEEHPELLKDQYWDEVVPRDLPYTLASECYRKSEPKGSAEFFKVKETEALYANITHRKSVGQPDEYADYESVDTPMVERRKNWFQRQVQRMSSVRRSSSTTYSSGLFGGTRSRHNSVYATPNEGGILPMTGQFPPLPVPLNQQQPAPHKVSIYDRILRRKSTRRGPGKLNVNLPPPSHRNRPRIPTPDVGKEVTDKDNKLVFPHNNNNNHLGNGNVNSQAMSSALVLTEAPQIMQPSPYRNPDSASGDTFTSATDMDYHSSLSENIWVLLPIAEADGNQSTITSTGSTAALAQAVLSPTLKSAGLQAVITQPVAVSTVSQPTVAITGPLLPGILATSTSNSNGSLKITEIPEDSGCGSSSGSPSSGEDRSRKTSTTSQRRGEVYV